MVMKLRKKPVEVEGVRWTGDNLAELRDFVGDSLVEGPDGALTIKTREGDHQVVDGAVVVKGVEGEFYPVDPAIFPQTFDTDTAVALEALTASQRKALKDSDFAVPEKRQLPIPDEKHIRLAWTFLAHTKDLTLDEKKKARGRILAAAKEHDMDTSDWTWASLEDVQDDARQAAAVPMDAIPYLLNQGAEEACELGKAFAKALRFGLDGVDPRNGEVNHERIRDEANDVLGLLAILNDELTSRGLASIQGVGDSGLVKLSTDKRLANLLKEYEAGRYSLPAPSTKED